MSQLGRTKIKGSTFLIATYQHLLDTQRYLTGLLEGLQSDVFKRGSISGSIDADSVTLTYHQGHALTITVPYLIQKRRDKDEFMYLVQDFLLNCYYSREYDVLEEPVVKFFKLAKLLGVDFRSIGAEAKEIERKFMEKIVTTFGTAEKLIE